MIDTRLTIPEFIAQTGLEFAIEMSGFDPNAEQYQNEAWVHWYHFVYCFVLPSGKTLVQYGSSPIEIVDWTIETLLEDWVNMLFLTEKAPTYEEWCEAVECINYKYVSDSKYAYFQKKCLEFQRFFGDELYNLLLYGTRCY